MSHVKLPVNLKINSLHTFNLHDKNSNLFCMINTIFTEVSYDFFFNSTSSNEENND